MNLKQFLKPDWRKIVVWIIIFLIIPIPGLVSMYLPPIPEICKTEPCPADVNRPMMFPIPNLIFLIIPSTHSLSSLDYNIRNIPLMIIIFLIISYLFSCFIVWIYDKFRKKQK